MTGGIAMESASSVASGSQGDLGPDGIPGSLEFATLGDSPSSTGDVTFVFSDKNEIKPTCLV